MKISPKCDAQNANNAPVCKHCGANLNEIPEANEPGIPDDKPPYHLGLVCMKGLLKTKPLPGKGIFMIRSSAAKALALVLCASFAFLLTACHKKNNYKGDIDKFVDKVGTTLGGSKYVFNSAEEASETFFGTFDLSEQRPIKEWIGKDYRTDFFKNGNNSEGFFFKGDYKQLWNDLENAYRRGETFFDENSVERKEYGENPVNPTVETLSALLEDNRFGMAVRAVELTRLYSMEESAYYSKSFRNIGDFDTFLGMRVIFEDEKAAKEYWNLYTDMDKAYLEAQGIYKNDQWIADIYKERMEAYHEMPEENYKYSEKSNKGHLTLNLGYFYDAWYGYMSEGVVAALPGANASCNVLFSIQMDGRELTMLCCFLVERDIDLEEIGKLYDELDLPNPLNTEVHGFDMERSDDKVQKQRMDPDLLTGFFGSYYPTFYRSPQGTVGVSDWTLRTAHRLLPFPVTRHLENVAWIRHAYIDPEDYLQTLSGN